MIYPDISPNSPSYIPSILHSVRVATAVAASARFSESQSTGDTFQEPSDARSQGDPCLPSSPSVTLLQSIRETAAISSFSVLTPRLFQDTSPQSSPVHASSGTGHRDGKHATPPTPSSPIASTSSIPSPKAKRSRLRIDLEELPLERRGPKSSSERAVACPVEGCAKTYAHAAGLRRHTKTIHNSVAYGCAVPSCSASYPRPDDLEYHALRAHGAAPDIPDAERTHACAIAGCAARFKYSYSLRQHAKDAHTQADTGGKAERTPKPAVLACPVDGCSKAFTEAGNLRRHVRTIHKGDKPYQCDFPGCDKAFGRSDHLLLHMESHDE